VPLVPSDDLEPVGLEVEAEGDAPGHLDGGARSTRSRWLGPALIGAALAVVGASIAFTPQHHAAVPPPTTAPAPPDGLAFNGRLAFLHGDQLSLPGGNVAITPAGTERDLTSVGNWVVVLGRRDRAGAWAIDADHPTTIHYLGAADRQFRSKADNGVWLVEGDQVRKMSVNGEVSDGPYSSQDPVVGQAGDGLVVQQGTDVVWWHPQTGDRVELGSGTVLDTGFESVLVLDTRERLSLIDVNTHYAFALDPPRGPTVPVDRAASSIDGSSVLFSAGDQLYRSGPIVDGTKLVGVGPFGHVVWTDRHVALVWWTQGALSMVDVGSGATRRLADIGVAVEAVVALGRDIPA
jgi:hypothetical protein